MQKVINSTEQEMLKSVNYIKEFNFNRFPKPFTVVTEKEYDDYEDTWYPEFIGIGQIHSDEEKALLVDNKEVGTIHLKYRFYATRGYAKCKFVEKVVDTNGKYEWQHRELFIRFGCEHKHAKLIDQDVFERVYKCDDCGLTWKEQTGY